MCGLSVGASCGGTGSAEWNCMIEFIINVPPADLNMFGGSGASGYDRAVSESNYDMNNPRWDAALEFQAANISILDLEVMRDFARADCPTCGDHAVFTSCAYLKRATEKHLQWWILRRGVLAKNYHGYQFFAKTEQNPEIGHAI